MEILKTKRLTRKSLLEFLEFQMPKIQPFSGSREEAILRMEEDWKKLNETLKIQNIPKKTRKNRRYRLKQKYGIVNSSDTIYREARTKLINAIKYNFGL